MSTATISQAKAHLGGLIDSALAGETVFIRQGRGDRRLVQLVPVVQPDPIPYLPPGALEISDEQLALHETFGMPSDPFKR